MKILVVDGDRDTREYLEDILGLMGNRVTCVADGYAAIDYVREHSVNLAYIDVDLPGIDGLETLKRIREIDNDALGLLFDCYHQQVTEGNLTAHIEALIDIIRHIHIADVPGRHEPGTGEINFTNLLRNIKTAGYNGYIGLEYIPFKSSRDSLNAVKRIVEQVG